MKDLLKMYEGALAASAVTKLAEAIFLSDQPGGAHAERAKWSFDAAQAFYAERDAPQVG